MKDQDEIPRWVQAVVIVFIVTSLLVPIYVVGGVSGIGSVLLAALPFLVAASIGRRLVWRLDWRRPVRLLADPGPSHWATALPHGPLVYLLRTL